MNRLPSILTFRKVDNMAFSSKSTNPNPLLRMVRQRPFALFGLPFLGLVVFSSFALSTFTQTRYDLNDSKTKSVSKEEELGMNKDRKKVDIREEYYVSVLTDNGDWVWTALRPNNGDAHLPIFSLVPRPWTRSRECRLCKAAGRTRKNLCRRSWGSLVQKLTSQRLNAIPSSLPSASDAALDAAKSEHAEMKRKKFSMAPTSNDDYEPIRVPRPAGVSEWGGVGGASPDAPVKGQRETDRWV